ncbi:MAG: FAD-dependent oxidoreductase [Tissierellaceae bacterium]|nr:FAD-dependent oxidoreductase [Tissierellaceae bacterium]
MKYKKLISLLLIAMLIVGIMGCSKEEPAVTPDVPVGSMDSGTTFSPGTYTSAAPGKNGDVTVEVTFDEKSIVSVLVKEHSETEGIGDTPIERLPKTIVEEQSLEVDIVSGATMTSNAILAAVEDCVKQAGGDVNALKGKEKSDDASTETELTTDIVIVGAGGTGLAAAASAHENGADVIVLEKLAVTGGSTSFSGGGISATGTRFQEELGIKDTKESWMKLWKERQATSNPDGKYPDYTLVDRFMDEAIKTTHWLVDVVKHAYGKIEGFGFDPVERLHFPVDGGGSVLTTNIEKHLKENNVKIMTETKGTELITNESGDVIGVMTEGVNGKIKINAKKVILATGGFAKSEELLERFIPEMAGTAEMSAATPGATGDGILMAEKVGAALYEEPWVIGLGIGSRIPEFGILDWDVSKILVNESGERFFNEADHYSIVTNNVAAQEKAWMIVDSKEANANAVELFKANSASEEIATGNTIEELANSMGVAVDSLVSTVDKFNKAYETGKDEFGKDKSMIVPLVEGPYYALRYYPKTMGTFGGVKTDEYYRVLREDGSIINNLYAGGECSNKVLYNQVYMSGSAVQLAVTSGRISGEHAAKSIK